MNTTALDNDKLETVVTETTEMFREERFKKCVLHLSDYFPHMLHIFSYYSDSQSVGKTCYFSP